MFPSLTPVSSSTLVSNSALITYGLGILMHSNSILSPACKLLSFKCHLLMTQLHVQFWDRSALALQTLSKTEFISLLWPWFLLFPTFLSLYNNPPCLASQKPRNFHWHFFLSRFICSILSPLYLPYSFFPPHLPFHALNLDSPHILQQSPTLLPCCKSFPFLSVCQPLLRWSF